MEYTLAGQPGRSETCHGCEADLKVCLNCEHYAPRLASQCREGRAEPVEEKHLANYCEYFEMARRVWTPKSEPGHDKREQSARESLRRLLGD